MSGFVRNSKYRHVYVEPPKKEETYTGFRLSTATGEQQYIKGNTKFFALALQGGGGPIGVIDYSSKGHYPTGAPMLAGHKGSVLDLDFNPFHEHLLASASDDSTVKIWGIPQEGLTETITEPLVDLHGHGRKVTLIRFHPTANSILGSISADHCLKIWDIEKGVAVAEGPEHPDLIQDLVWSFDGRLWGTTCKDKVVRVGDARLGGDQVAATIKTPHEGAKSTKLCFLGDRPLFASLGFTKQSQRQLKLWDIRDTSKPLHKLDIDQAAGVIIPFFDVDTSILYLCGKGDGNIRYYEISENSKVPVFALSEYRSTTAAKGSCFLPKRGLDVMKCQTAKCLKLTQQGGQGIVEPLSFVVPRKSDAFQDDIFPPTFSGEPALTSDEWLAGQNKPQPLKSLDPTASSDTSARRPADSKPNAASVKKPAFKTPAILQAELDAANKTIQALTKRLLDAGLSADV
eukprot:CAMPEP_0118898172 /NCGR_PEP_ID=MMETSP1166-20130328/5272_1 /TAXON_ID=1104430 /ORGANISM="Chrysoreinhardia sp, Strain CCMP3193" /LENGTH=457 /DNA_ID=CAMNT_0006837267 /DNA_START=122 /DNA_END=1495 /DNA_ORIENTATION=+